MHNARKAGQDLLRAMKCALFRCLLRRSNLSIDIDVINKR